MKMLPLRQKSVERCTKHLNSESKQLVWLERIDNNIFMDAKWYIYANILMSYSYPKNLWMNKRHDYELI